MLKITPYLGIIVLIISIGGLIYPLLGYLVVGVIAVLLLISPFLGRWFCGNLCPRGSFNDFWIGKISKNKKINKIFSNLKLRISIIILMIIVMGFRIANTKGNIEKLGMVFVSICIITTIIAILFGIFISPRTWCTFCPMGTIQRFLGGEKYQLKFDSNKCTDCNICNKVCPMQLNVSNILNKPDCIKCRRCIDACPKSALNL